MIPLLSHVKRFLPVALPLLSQVATAVESYLPGTSINIGLGLAHRVHEEDNNIMQCHLNTRSVSNEELNTIFTDDDNANSAANTNHLRIPKAVARDVSLGTPGLDENDEDGDNDELDDDALLDAQFDFDREVAAGRGGGGRCPAVWKSISRELSSLFQDGRECSTAARTAIRTALHDCIPWRPSEGAGGCDGSLFLAGEFTRAENRGVDKSAVRLADIARRHKVGIADMFQFAAAHAIVTCPLGPRIRTFVGRPDSARPEPEGRIPHVNNSVDDLLRLFSDRGFNTFELAALLGAHSTSRQFFVDPSRRGAPQDSTPGVWDVAYYGETLNGTAPFIFDSDRRLSQDPRMRSSFQQFVDNQQGWNVAFEQAWGKLALLGVKGGASGLVDCTGFLPRPRRRQ